MTNPLHSSESQEHYTPKPIIEAARRTMQGIDLDPCSCEQANRIVNADVFWDEKTDGLHKFWTLTGKLHGPPAKVLLNAPGGIDRRGNSIHKRWLKKVLKEHKKGRVSSAVIICFNIGTACSIPDLFSFPICIPTSKAQDPCVSSGTGRIRFDAVIDGVRCRQASPTQNNIIVFLPPEDPAAIVRFGDEFKRFGATGILGAI